MDWWASHNRPRSDWEALLNCRCQGDGDAVNVAFHGVVDVQVQIEEGRSRNVFPSLVIICEPEIDFSIRHPWTRRSFFVLRGLEGEPAVGKEKGNQRWKRRRRTVGSALLVNKTLYEKTLASGFGSVHFLLDASELQQYKEAILLYAILLHPEKYEVFNRKSIGAECEMFLFDKFNLQIDMPIDEAMDTLMRLDLVSEFPVEGNLKPNAIPCSKAYEHLRKRWSSLLDLGS
ncbi:hypothetical protein MA16_Dca001962 [Dendrobium catenatum]|uniref:Uncharacterized protein n=1 Tax=Dendrobium catenatum TaxID=906689 RepID=A0A2I0XDY7_9ASPA|nr:hypothetical protein MA16_Dca001962 [Dendrobium catenatum]